MRCCIYPIRYICQTKCGQGGREGTKFLEIYVIHGNPLPFNCNCFDSNLDIREAILQLLSVIRNGNSKFEQHSFKDRKLSEDILDRIDKLGGQRGTERKIDNISTFLLRWAFFNFELSCFGLYKHSLKRSYWVIHLVG